MQGVVVFPNRPEAGRRLGVRLIDRRPERPVVLGLARGGVPVAFEVARTLEAPLDVLVARKLGAPDRPELAIGAIAPGAKYLAQDLIHLLHVPRAYIARETAHQEREMDLRLELFREGRPAVRLAGRVAILVDDGIATGATVLAAIHSVRRQGAKRILVATPVCAAQTLPLLREQADEVVCLETPEDFIAVGYWYTDFSQTADEEVISLLRRATTGWKLPKSKE